MPRWRISELAGFFMRLSRWDEFGRAETRSQEPDAAQVGLGLTALGLIFGVAAVISMLAVGEGAARDARVRIEELGATNIILRSVKPSDEAQAASGRAAPLILRYGLRYADFERIVETIPTIKPGAGRPRDPQTDPPWRTRVRRTRRWHD